MRNLNLAFALLLGFTLAGGGVTASCQDSADDCRLIGTCCPDGTLSCFTVRDGGDISPPPECVPSTNSAPVAATCGVFVSREGGDDTSGKGTPTAPYKSIGKALAENASVIYACAGATPYSE